MSVHERMSAEAPPRCGVLGSPIVHSLSPVLHRAAYVELGLDWEYDAYDVGVGTLPGFVAGLGPQWRGLSLTMPLKQLVVDLCDEVDALGQMLGSVNTVVIDRGRRGRAGRAGRRLGSNTDVPGLVAAFAASGVRRLRSATVVGAGATAASALAAIAELGGERVTVLARSVDRATTLEPVGSALGLGLRFVGFDASAGLVDDEVVDAVVSTIPATAQEGLASVGLPARAGVVCDVTYDPPRTPLLTAAERAGVPTIGGFELLVQQAALQVQLMTGAAQAPLEAMRRAGLAALEQPQA
ncbi:MAG: shikimate dehydrogenase [Nocardioidaceae bacterium]